MNQAPSEQTAISAGTTATLTGETVVEPQTRRRRRWPWALVIVLGIGLFFMLLVPVMCGPAEPLNRIKCASNLRQLGFALQIFAREHQNALPRDWSELILNTDITAESFVCPTDNFDRAPGNTPAEWAKAIAARDNHFCSYVYAGNGLTLDSAAADEIIAFEPLTNHDRQGFHVLFADGHVAWVDVGDAADRALYDKLRSDAQAGVRPLRLQP